MQDTNGNAATIRPLYRDTIRENNGTRAARDTLAKFEAESRGFDDVQWAGAAGKFAATVEDLLGIIENLTAVADTRDRAREYAEQIEQSEGRETPAITAAAVYASTVRMGKVRWAEPAGSFEAVRRQVEDGWAVYARFVGETASARTPRGGAR